MLAEVVVRHSSMARRFSLAVRSRTMASKVAARVSKLVSRASCSSGSKNLSDKVRRWMATLASQFSGYVMTVFTPRCKRSSRRKSTDCLVGAALCARRPQAGSHCTCLGAPVGASGSHSLASA